MDKGIDQIAVASKEELQTQKALRSLAEHQGPELPAMISELDVDEAQKPIEVSDAKDITPDFLAPVDIAKSTLPDSSISVYKGILKRLVGMGSKPDTVAILAGSDMAITGAVTTENLEETLGSTTAREYWESREQQVMGLGVFREISDPKDTEQMVSKVLAFHKPMILLECLGVLKIRAWIVSMSDGGPVWTPVRVGHQTTKRKRNETISFVHCSKIGISFDDQVRCC